MGRRVTKYQVEREAKKLFKEDRFKCFKGKVFLFGSMVKDGYSIHDADIFVEIYAPCKKFNEFGKALGLRLNGFPVHTVTYADFHMKKPTRFHPYYFKIHMKKMG